MTLILTEISTLGIVMAADSAVTEEVITLEGEREYRVLTGVNKLQVIRKLSAGIAVWGQGTITIEHNQVISSDLWLRDFIRVNQEEFDSIDEFALLLQNELRKYIAPINVAQKPGGTIGFLLAGYVEHDGQRLPSFYHIHNGISTTLRDRGIRVIDPSIIKANHDITPTIARQLFESGQGWITRNGDYVTYVRLFEHIGQFLQDLPIEDGLVIPHLRNLKERAEWLRFQIKTMSDLYSLSNRHLPIIGGKIDTLMITPDGIDDCGLTF